MGAVHATDTDFNNHTATGKPTLVDFWATWCGPCRQVSPIVDQIADEHPEFAVVKVDIDQAPNATQSYGVRGVPTLAVLDSTGNVVEVINGPKPKAFLLAALERAAVR